MNVPHPASVEPLSEERVAAYVRGELSPAEREQVEAAIDREPEWLEVVALLARESPPRTLLPQSTGGSSDDRCAVDRLEREQAARLRPGTRLGRYHVEHPIGHGGMGVVHAAYDPELDRHVAIKLLRTRAPDAHSRLLREARALARLSDPHVNTVYDVGTFEGGVFIAMERLEGQTLRSWRAASARTWQEVLGVFVQAGRGLVAAHRAGLVHRDFKPSNVMLTGDGRVVVIDFGLAHASPEATSSDDMLLASANVEHATRPRVLGTPAYMAPEQRRGEPCGPRADQFSFCVALFEALHGALPPSAGATEVPILHAAATGRLPASIERLLARGLATDPGDRHPSMAALVDALAASLRPRHTTRRVALVLAPAVAVVSWVAGRGQQEPCTESARTLAQTWNPERAAAVRAALERSNRPWSGAVRDEVDRHLHAYAAAWIAEHAAICRATQVDGTQPEAALDRRMHCLDRRRRSLHALLEVLEVADVETASRSVQATQALPSVSSCRKDTRPGTASMLPDNPRQRTRAEALFDRIAQVEALREAARYPEAAALADRVVHDAAALDHTPTLVDARLAAGWVHTDLGDHEAAETHLREALHAAETIGYEDAVTRASIRLAWVVGYKLARHEEGRRMASHAAAWSQRLERPVIHELARLRTLGWIEHEAGAPQAALTAFERALELAVDAAPREPWADHERGLVLNGLGAAALSSGDLQRAQESFADAAAHLEARLGSEHPDVARLRNNVASLLRGQGKAEEARRILEHNLAVFEATFGPEHPLVGQTLVNIAVAELDLGRHTPSALHAERAIAVLRAAHGPEHPLVAKAHTIRGDARIQLGRAREAIDDLELALELERRTLGADHPSVGIVHSNLGAAFYQLGLHTDAAEHQRRSLEILEGSLGPEHPNLAFVIMSLGLTRRAEGHTDDALALFRRAETLADDLVRHTALTRIGEVLLDRGQVGTAIEHLQRALVLQADLEADPGFAGDTRFALARARWAAGDRLAARAEAEAAIAAYQAGDDVEPEATARRWLEELP